jgi:translocation and assembly module TamA
VLLLTSSPVEARQSSAMSAHRIQIAAPDSVHDLLQQHFELPDHALKNDAERATLLRRAQREIAELLATEAYFTPTITFTPPGLDGIEVIKVTPGPRTLVTQLDLQFSGELADELPAHLARVARLRAAWLLSVGMPFRSADWEQAKAALLASVASTDYAAAQLTDSKAQVDTRNAHATLTVLIDSGPTFHFGEIKITGLARYEEQLVLQQLRFHSGEPYSRDALLAFQTRLQNMAQFSSVLVSIEPDVALHQAVPVQVAITEAKPRRISVGIGYSSNNGARSEINYANHNFMQGALNLNSSFRLEQNRQSLTTGIDTVPDENGYMLSWGAVGEATHIAGLQTARDKFGVTRSHSLGRIDTRLGLNFQQEQRKPLGGTNQFNQALVPDWQWHRRAVDSLLYPRTGMVTEIRLGGGTHKLLSDRDFMRGYLRQQWWWPIAERDALTLRGEVGYTASSSRLGIPQEYLFRAGGSQSVRGYAYQSLGVVEGAAVVGGRALLTSSIEYTHWFAGNWGVALFTDVGGAAEDINTLRLLAAYGSGIRWRSPAGPLALDLAWGKQTHAMRMHFAIAVAF